MIKRIKHNIYGPARRKTFVAYTTLFRSDIKEDFQDKFEELCLRDDPEMDIDQGNALKAEISLTIDFGASMSFNKPDQPEEIHPLQIVFDVAPMLFWGEGILKPSRVKELVKTILEE